MATLPACSQFHRRQPSYLKKAADLARTLHWSSLSCLRLFLSHFLQQESCSLRSSFCSPWSREKSRVTLWTGTVLFPVFNSKQSIVWNYSNMQKIILSISRPLRLLAHNVVVASHPISKKLQATRTCSLAASIVSLSSSQSFCLSACFRPLPRPLALSSSPHISSLTSNDQSCNCRTACLNIN